MKKLFLVFIGLLSMGLISSHAMAYLPDTTTVLQPAFDAVETDAQSLADIAWLIMIGITGLVVVMGLGKKLFKKVATG